MASGNFISWTAYDKLRTQLRPHDISMINYFSVKTFPRKMNFYCLVNRYEPLRLHAWEQTASDMQ